MDISLRLVPSSAVNTCALPQVLSDVPNPGIITDIIFARGTLNFLNASIVTIKARVLSKPPDMPITAFFELIFFIR